MTVSTLVTDYLGAGAFSAIPADPPIASGAVAVYLATDLGISFVWNGTIWVAAGAPLFGSGAPSTLRKEGAMYFNTATSPYTAYVQHSGAWEQFGGGSGGGSGADWSPGVPALSDFTQVNTSGATIVENSGVAISLRLPGTTPGFAELYKGAPANPYRLAVVIQGAATITNSKAIGIGFHDVTTGKFEPLFIGTNGGGPMTLFVGEWPSATGVGTVVWFQTLANFGGGNLFLGLRDDGTNVYFETSGDGSSWEPIYSHAKSGGYLSDYTHLAWMAYNNDGTSNISATLFLWDEDGLTRAPAPPGIVGH